MNVTRAVLTAGLAAAVAVSSVGMASALSSNARRRTAHAAGRHFAHRGEARVIAGFGAPASDYYNDSYYGGPAYGFYGSPTYGFYRGGY